MGQGSDSCENFGFGLDDYEYDNQQDALSSGNWIQKCGTPINIHQMTLSHLKGARRVAQRFANQCTFSCDEEIWQDWVELFDSEIYDRERLQIKSLPKISKPAEPVRGSKVQMICHCGTEYSARTADIKRGWALSCSKSCAAIRRDYNKPKAKRKKD